MYSPEIQQLLEENDIETGDLIKVNGREGRLMPKPETGNEDIIVLKLESGYNIGLRPEEVELVEKREVEELEKPEIQHSEEKDDILVLHTGGTIASRVSYEEGGVKPAFDPEDLLEMYPEVAEEVNIHSEVIAQMYSGDMEPGHWQQVAEKIDKVKDDYDSIIVGHGTDTMAFTGAALTLMLKGIETGVLLVGAQRSSDRPSSDSSMNFYSAAKFLKETDFSSIGICMHENSSDNRCVILPAAKARKMHTSRRDAFEAINAKPLGYVNYQSGEIEENFEKTNREYEFRPNLETDVKTVKISPGINTDEFDFLLEKQPEGVVIEGTGLGHAPVNAFDDKTQHHEEILQKIDELEEKSLVAMSSQCLHGRTNMNIYEYGLKLQEAGVIEAKDMHPELAYVKLMWALGQADSREEAEKLFQENVAGEIQQRSRYSE